MEKLAILLQEPPRKSENQDLKNETYILVMQAVCSVKAKELGKILELPEEALEVLLEYIYKGWAMLSNKDPSKRGTQIALGSLQVIQNTSLLMLHKQIVEKLGIGAILKVANYQEHSV